MYSPIALRVAPTGCGWWSHVNSPILESAVDFAVHPPTGKRRSGGAEQDFVPKPDAPVNALVQIVAGQ